MAHSGPYERQRTFDFYGPCLASKLAFGFSITTLNINIQRAPNNLMATSPLRPRSAMASTNLPRAVELFPK
ncbi:hypothetical protein CAZ03_28055 [Pseudomonas aeruginosa]|nr:hypothetical protein CAZ03_28055 [Pseudomonas aeruginosa]